MNCLFWMWGPCELQRKRLHAYIEWGPSNRCLECVPPILRMHVSSNNWALKKMDDDMLERAVIFDILEIHLGNRYALVK